MKTILLLPFVFLFTFQSNAQVAYVPFDFESSVWSEFYYSNFFYNEYTDVSINGDTIIDNVVWQKLHRSGMGYYYDSPDQIDIVDSMVIDNFIGLVRENDQKQIFFMSPLQTEATILYDFNIDLGDTISLMDFGMGPHLVVVESLDTIEYCGILRNKYNLQFVEPVVFGASLIEGIGSTSGILPRIEVFESGGTLLCYSNSNCDCGEQLVNVLETPELDFVVFPNPVQDKVYIESGVPISNIEVYDCVGQLVLESANQNDIDVRALGKGIYFCKVKDFKGRFSVRKIVKE